MVELPGVAVGIRSVLIFTVLISIFAVVATRVIYNLLFHDLRKFPGPKLWAVSRLPWHFYNLQGRLAWKILALHQQYGSTIRIAPDELSYTAFQAWKKIYGQSKPEFCKCLDGRGIAPVNPQKHLRGLIAADQDKHARLRRAIAPAFTDRALREQEQCLQKHSSSLTQHLKRRCIEGPVDLVKWFNLATFDIISDLAFSQPEGCLDNADQPWLAVMGARAKSIRWYQFTIYYGIEDIIRRFAPKSLTKARQQHMALTAAKVSRRLKENLDSKDFMSYILDNKTEKLTNAELAIMASAFLVAGSGTSARAMSATVHYLTNNPEKMARAMLEVRSALPSEDDINIRSTAQLKFLVACIDEAMRLHPPQPGSLPRFVPAKGEEIEGQWINGGNAVGVHQLSSGHSKKNFTRAEEFLPERWLSESDEFALDDRASVQPFSYGPRGCIGMSLAHAEMRLILAKLLFSFDLEATEGGKDWTTKQRSYLTWELLPLPVRLIPRGGLHSTGSRTR